MKKNQDITPGDLFSLGRDNPMVSPLLLILRTFGTIPPKGSIHRTLLIKTVAGGQRG